MNGDNNGEGIETEVLIVGAGPIGIELAIALRRAAVKTVLLEAKQIGEAISRWPAATHFYSTPEHVALAGVPVHNVNQGPLSGEQYLAYLRMLVEMFDLNLRVYEPVTNIDREQEGFAVTSSSRYGKRTYRSQYVILATGGMARPRMLNIPGEHLPHVSHYFPGPHPYFRTNVLVVGGKNSALESALRCWRAGAKVSLSYRRAAIDYEVVKPHLAMDIRDRLGKGEVSFLPATLPVAITPTSVLLVETADGKCASGGPFAYKADFVLLCTGFEADMALFRRAGVTLVGKELVPQINPQTMETNVPGLFAAGTAAAGTQGRFTTFISTSHDHVARIVKAITGHAAVRLGTVDARNNAVTWEEIKAN